jgi:anti-sigma regulatory factor (Ser/Thr protein kinase)
MEDPSRSLVFAAEAASLPLLAGWTEAMVQRLSLAPRKAYALELCLEEIVANILLHGQLPGRGVQVRVSLKVDPLRLIVEDDGAEFDPTLQPEAEVAADLDSAAIGGRGLALVRRFSVAMGYRREAGWNRLVIGLA